MIMPSKRTWSIYRACSTWFTMYKYLLFLFIFTDIAYKYVKICQMVCFKCMYKVNYSRISCINISLARNNTLNVIFSHFNKKMLINSTVQKVAKRKPFTKPCKPLSVSLITNTTITSKPGETCFRLSVSVYLRPTKYEFTKDFTDFTTNQNEAQEHRTHQVPHICLQC